MIASRRVLAVGVLVVGGAVAAGCEDRRYVEPVGAPGTEVVPDPAPGVDVDIKTPAGRVSVDGASGILPPKRDVKVDVGGGHVEVDIDGKPVLERLRERRAERNEVVPATP